jgi:hypothetical protein
MPKRPKLSYANVVATLALFVALGGGAMAASQLGKNSVGTKQLKKNAVTKAKIKKNSVATAKIKNGAVARKKLKNSAVNGAKIADGSVTGTEIDAASTPFSRIVYEARGHGSVSIPKEGPATYALDNPTYTQEANRDDSYFGALDVTFKPTCTPPRQAQAYILLDPANPAEPDETNIVGLGATQDKGGGEVGKRISIGPYLGGGFQGDIPTNHTLYLGVQVDCEAGEGATATFGAVDVIGTK